MLGRVGRRWKGCTLIAIIFLKMKPLDREAREFHSLDIVNTLKQRGHPFDADILSTNQNIKQQESLVMVCMLPFALE